MVAKRYDCILSIQSMLHLKLSLFESLTQSGANAASDMEHPSINNLE